MPSLSEEKANKASIEVLEALRQLLESDPYTIAGMTAEEIGQGLQMMGVTPADELPDRIKMLISEPELVPASTDMHRAYEGKRKIAGARRNIASACGLLFFMSVYKTLTSPVWRAGGLCLLLAGCTILFSGTQSKGPERQASLLYLSNSRCAESQANAELAQKASLEKEKQLEKAKQMEKVRSELLYIAYGARETAEKNKMKSGAGKKGKAKKMAESQNGITLLIPQIERATARLSADEVLSPHGYPLDRFAVRDARPYDLDPTCLFIKSAPGARVIATADGVVVADSLVNGSGKFVRLHHSDGLSTDYGPLSESVVVLKQSVRAGQTIGYTLAPPQMNEVNFSYRVVRFSRPLDTLPYVKTFHARTKCN